MYKVYWSDGRPRRLQIRHRGICDEEASGPSWAREEDYERLDYRFDLVAQPPFIVTRQVSAGWAVDVRVRGLDLAAVEIGDVALVQVPEAPHIWSLEEGSREGFWALEPLPLRLTLSDGEMIQISD